MELGEVSRKDHEPKRGKRSHSLVKKLKQVHIRTSPDASPENVDVFVGSDSTNSVTAPCYLNRTETLWNRV